MDILSVVGLSVFVAAMYYAVGADAEQLLDSRSFYIVIVGSLALLCYVRR